MTLYTDDELLAANDAGMEWDHNRHDERTRAEAILDAVAPAIAARALREAAAAIEPVTTTGRYPEESAVLHERESVADSLRARADEIEAAP